MHFPVSVPAGGSVSITVTRTSGENAVLSGIFLGGTPPATAPGAPTGLGATAGNGSAQLAWTAPASNGGSPITGYRIYRGTSSGGETFLTAVGVQTNFGDTGLTNGTTYFYLVRAVNAIGEGPPSNEAQATPTAPATAPGAPTGLGATAGNGSAQLAWTAPASNGGSPITGYRIYRGTSSGGETFLTAVGVQTNFGDTGLTNGTTYFYLVRAVNAIGEGPPSNEAQATPTAPATAPGAPTGLGATAGNGSAQLAWTAPASNGGSPITGYRIYRGTSSGGETFLTAVGVQTNFGDTGLTNGTTYFYLVRAVNAIGEGPPSNEAQATPTAPATAPGAPTGLGATAGNGSAQLAWTAPASNGGSPITGYRIYRGTSSGGETFLTAVGVQTNFGDTGLTNGTTYFYLVRAVNAIGEGPPSNEAQATPKTTPSAPRTLTAKQNRPQGIALTWKIPTTNGGSPITGYRIYRGTSSGGETPLTAVGSVLQFTDTETTAGTRYYYVVRAVNAIGEGPSSSEVSAVAR